MRKMIGKKVAIASILLGIGICLFHYGFGLVKVGDRDSGNIDLPQAVRERIEKECRVAEAEACAVYGMKLTCELLRFSKKNDIDAGAANCVGYAQLCSAVCNYALEKNGMRNRAKPVVGYVTFCGLNLCKLLKGVVPEKYKNFVKDHDFVEIDLGERVRYFDASLYDYGIDCTTTCGKE